MIILPKTIILLISRLVNKKEGLVLPNLLFYVYLIKQREA